VEALQVGCLTTKNYKKMKTYKIIIFNIISFLLAINTAYLYGINFQQFSLSAYLSAIISIVLFFVVNLFISLSYIVKKVIHRKNLQRISLLIIFILLVLSLIARGKEVFASTFCYICWVNTIGLFVLFVINISVLKDLRRVVRGLFIKFK